MDSRPFRLLTLSFLVVASLALYARAFAAGFVADDWPFLSMIDTARSPLVCFEPLVGRYLRPLVVLLYYVNFQLFGLWPVSYHVSVALLHALNAWLLYRLATELDAGREIALFASALFLAFAGHSEAVAWIGGVADVLLAPFALGAMLLTARALRTDAAPRATAAVALLSVAGMLAKETSVIVPALILAVCALMVWRAAPDRRVVLVRRSIMLVGIPAVAVAVYLLLRTQILGNPVSAYSDLATSGGMFFRELRAFVLRVFLPAYSRLALAWVYGWDIAILAAGLGVVVAALARADRHRRALLLFAGAAIAISLAPALPLTISVRTTETERVVYIPTAFGALLTVLAIDGLVKSDVVRRSVLVALVAAHAVVLQRFNRNWVEAGDAFTSIVRSFVETVRAHDPGENRKIFVLNLPDNFRGAYIFRRGFYEALHFTAPDLERRHESIVSVSSHTLWNDDDPVGVRRRGPMEFGLDVWPNLFLQTTPPVREFYEFVQWSPSGYVARFADTVSGSLVMYTVGGQVRFLTVLDASDTMRTTASPQSDAHR